MRKKPSVIAGMVSGNLVGGLVAMNFIFPYVPINIGNFIIPIDELIFFRGVAQPPTSYHRLCTSRCQHFVPIPPLIDDPQTFPLKLHIAKAPSKSMPNFAKPTSSIMLTYVDPFSRDLSTIFHSNLEKKNPVNSPSKF